MTDKTIKHEALIHGHLVYDHLIGLPFKHGETDCYECGRRVMLDNLGIKLANYARPDDWWINGMDLYMQNFKNEGFYIVETDRLEDVRVLDWFLIALPDARSPARTVTNHCGVYLGNGKMIHHRLGKLSQVTNYQGMWRNMTTAIIRHKDVPDLIDRTQTNLDIMDYILPHKRDILLGALNDKHKKD